MVDWLIQVFTAFKCFSEPTFFLTVQIMDNFLSSLKEEKIIFPRRYLYLLGITAIMIACKVEEVEIVPIKTIVSVMGHDKFSKQDVTEMELLILKTLKYKMPTNSLYYETHIKLRNTIKES